MNNYPYPPHARIKEKRKRIIENRWHNCTIIMRGKFMQCQIKRIHKKMLADDPLRAIFLPLPCQILEIHKQRKGNNHAK